MNPYSYNTVMAAKYLGVSCATIRSMVKNRTLACKTLNGNLRFRKEDLDAQLKDVGQVAA